MTSSGAMKVLLLSIIFGLLYNSSFANEHQFQDKLLKEQKKAVIWNTSFLGVFSVGMALNAYNYFSTKKDDKKFDAGVDFIKSTLAVGSMLLDPFLTKSIYDDYSQSKDALAKAIAREAYEKSLTNHLLSGLVNLLGGAAIWLIDDRRSDGIRNFALGTLISEIKIWTAPSNLSKAKEQTTTFYYNPFNNEFGVTILF